MIDRLKKNYFLLLITFLLIYFFFNLLDGDRCLISYIEKKDLYEQLKKNQNDLNDKITCWLNNEKNLMREKIRINGFYHAHKMNSYNARVKYFMNKINEFLKQNESGSF